MCERKDVRGRRSELRDRLTLGLAIALTVASATAALTTGLTAWISTLAATTPVSLSLAFRSWAQIIEFNLSIWLWTFSLVCLSAFVVFSRWFYVSRLFGHESPRPLTSDL
jgi:hypothetical protein